MALPPDKEHHNDHRAKQLSLLSPEELAALRRSISPRPPARRTASSEAGGVSKPRGPKDGYVQDELPFQ